MREINLKCFLCLDLCPDTPDHNGFSDNENYLLRFSSFVKFPISIELNYERNTFISICEECQGILKTFGELLKSVEIAQMKVDFCVKQIRDVMMEGEQGNSALENTEFADLRKNLIDKTLLKLQKSRFQPTVRLTKSSLKPRSHRRKHVKLDSTEMKPEEKIKSEIAVAQEDTTLEFPIDEEYHISSVPNDDDDTRTDMKNENIVVRKQRIDKSGKRINAFYCLRCKKYVLNSDQHVKKFHHLNIQANQNANEAPGKDLNCPYCRAVFNEKRTRKKGWADNMYGVRSLRRHLLNYHCEHFFPTHKHQAITLGQFHKIFGELLFPDLVDGKASCVFCDKAFIYPVKRTKKNEVEVKLHYMDEHFKILEKRLKEIQEDPKLYERLAKCNINGKICKCQVYLPHVPRFIRFGSLKSD